ncbi:MAG: CotH kinase family protein [Pedobacter sp.]|uniref:CotH kinase family protein n=1 Tax=Pedobacter sp. TaxID=1411316 RepID=UPI0028093DB1|nr:CotH kinase family protein [Pedobacter sp.]MDQ8004986.1 CotH kinase family protein [Pedobacter sp.]
MRISLRVLCVLFLLIASFSCKKKASKPALATAKLVSYTLKKENNPTVLSNDIIAEIKGNDILVTLSEGMNLSKMVASFSYEGTSITINGVAQKTDFTSNNFANVIVYEIAGEDGAAVKYTLKINAITDDELVFESFILEKAKNSDLQQDVGFQFKGDSVLATTTTLDNKQLKPTFVTKAKEVLINNVKLISGQTTVDFSANNVVSLISSKGYRKDVNIKVKWVSATPHIYIVTDGNSPIVSKDNYLKATVNIDGKGIYADVNTTTSIKGRGNSTWLYAKKPYRLKLDSKTSIFGLPKAKNWVLLANYLDGTLMLNAVALKAGQLLNIPYTNHFVPVDVTINNTYMGSYLFTEQVEVDENRVNIADGGTLLELDSYYDETYKFKSTNYQLPVNIKYPELTAQSEVAAHQMAFQTLENLVFATSFPNNNYLDYMDKDILVNFLIVANLTDNEELSHPKSTYLYKPKNGKYCMGPLWDFDWAYGYEGSGVHFSSATRPLFSSSVSTRPGYKFFMRLLSDPTIKALYKQKWQAFKTNQLPVLLTFVDNYAKQIKLSKDADYVLWKKGDVNFTNDVAKLKQYLTNRANYIDTYVASF